FPRAGVARARPSPGHSTRRPGKTRRHYQRPRQARRLCRLPRRRFDHAMGLRAARRIEGALLIVMAGLDPAIPIRDAQCSLKRDCRDKPAMTWRQMTFPDIIPKLQADMPKL